MKNQQCNNFEAMCYCLIKDLLGNKPKDINNQVVKYSDEDRTKYISIIKENINELENVRNSMDKEIYEFILFIYKSALDLLIKQKI